MYCFLLFVGGSSGEIEGRNLQGLSYLSGYYFGYYSSAFCFYLKKIS
jgi:hypothetical protein